MQYSLVAKCFKFSLDLPFKTVDYQTKFRVSIIIARRHNYIGAIGTSDCRRVASRGEIFLPHSFRQGLLYDCEQTYRTHKTYHDLWFWFSRTTLALLGDPMQFLKIHRRCALGFTVSACFFFRLYLVAVLGRVLTTSGRSPTQYSPTIFIVLILVAYV